MGIEFKSIFLILLKFSKDFSLLSKNQLFSENKEAWQEDHESQREIPVLEADPCRKQFSDEYLDSLEEKLSRLIQKSSKKREKLCPEPDPLYQQLGLYTKSQETVSFKTPASQTASNFNVEKEGLTEFLLFLGNTRV